MPKMTDKEKECPWITDKTCKVNNSHDTGVPGTMALIATDAGTPYPLSIVWYRFSSNPKVIDVVNSYTIDWMQRRGLRTELQRQLFRWYSDIEYINTSTGTESGHAWMMKVGYKEHADGYMRVSRKNFHRLINKK